MQYGIEGKHYRVEDGYARYMETKPEDTYKMNNFYTGNVYIKYATEETAEYIENAKKSNLTVAPSAFFGLYPSFKNVSSQAVYECVKTFSEEAFRMLENGEITVAEFAVGALLNLTRKIEHSHKKLEKEMSEYIRETTDNDRVIYQKGESDDFVDSFNLCNLGITKYLENGPKVDTPFYIGNLGMNVLNNSTYKKRTYNKRG